jgi:hypothetical protein
LSANGNGDFGGGINNTGTLTVTNSTFSGNGASGGGGGIFTFSFTVTLANTILANSPSGLNCGSFRKGVSIDNGGNLADDGSCGFTSSTSSVTTTAKLNRGTLANNGGPTPTIALGAGSVAIDYTSTNCPSTDQCGVARPDNGETKCDSGAYEFQGESDLGLANVPANITAEATSASGAPVTYTAPTAADESGDTSTAAVSCAPASGATFALGPTPITCTATDSDDTNSPVSASFTVMVHDTTPPTLHLPANITAAASSPAGAVVSYSASATDLVDGTDL